MGRAAVAGLVAALALAGMTAVAHADHSVFELISTGPADTGANAAGGLFVTRDGSHMFFNSTGRLTADDTDSQSDIYRRSGGTVTRVSTGPQGGNADEYAFLHGITPDGQSVVFSTEEQLTSTDTDAALDLYKRTGDTTTLITIGPNGEHGVCPIGAGGCAEFRGISDDGRRVFFNHGGHLVAGDEEPQQCQYDDGDAVYEWPCVDGYENLDGVTRLVTTGPNDPHAPTDHRLEAAAGGKTWFAADVAMLPGDRAGRDVYEWSDGTLTAVTSDASSFTYFLAASEDGQRVFYWTGAIWEARSGPDLLRTPGTTMPLSSFMGISRDGDHLYFLTQQSLVAQDTDGATDLYEQTSAGYQLMSANQTGPPDTTAVMIFKRATPDGDRAYFVTAEPLVAEDVDNGGYDLYEFDSATGTSRLVSTGPTDPGGPFPPFSPSPLDVGFAGASDDGSRVFFNTELPLVSADTNTETDVYERTGGTTEIVSVSPYWTGGNIGGGPVTADGSKVFLFTLARLLPADTDAVGDIYVSSRGDRAGYPRPAAASPVRLALVPAYGSCTSPNREHGPPLAFASCAPPPLLTTLTLGVGDGDPTRAKSVGHVRLRTLRGAPGGPDDSDVQLELSLTNVMWQSDWSDYTGEVRARTALRITDRDADVPATMDIPFSFDATCAATADSTIGGHCAVSTTADTLVPGMVREGAGAVWQIGQVDVLDGSEDGDPSTFPEESGVLAVQGVFVP